MSPHPAFEARKAYLAMLEAEKGNPRLITNPEWIALKRLAQANVKDAVLEAAR